MRLATRDQRHARYADSSEPWNSTPARTSSTDLAPKERSSSARSGSRARAQVAKNCIREGKDKRQKAKDKRQKGWRRNVSYPSGDPCGRLTRASWKRGDFESSALRLHAPRLLSFVF